MAAQLGLGTTGFMAGYGLGQTTGAPRELVVDAVQAGLRYIDTAAVYADAERTLGSLSGLLATHGVVVATKVAVVGAAATVEASVRASLHRLRVADVAELLWHSATIDALSDSASCDALVAVRDRGLARRVGASTYGVDAARYALACGWCDVVQIEFSILNQELRAVVAARRAGQQVVVRSVLCKGLLTPRRAHLNLPAVLGERLGAIDRIARSVNLTTPQLAIRFALDDSGADVVLIGASSPAEVMEAAAAAAASPLPADVVNALRALDAGDSDWSHPERWPTIPESAPC